MLYTAVIITVVYLEVRIRLATSRNSMIRVILDKENYPELDDGGLTSNEQLTCFNKAREHIVGRFKGA